MNRTRIFCVVVMLGAINVGVHVWAEGAAPTLSPEYLSRVVTATREPKVASVLQRSSLVETVTQLSGEDFEAAREAWSICTKDIAEVEIPVDVESFILYILNRTYMQLNPDLLIGAEKVRFFTVQIAAVEAHIVALRKQETAYKPDESKETTIEEVSLAEFVPGGTAIRSAGEETILRSELAGRIVKWERTWELVSDESLIAQDELKQVMAKQESEMQAMSMASKMLHDVAGDLLKGSS